MANVRIGISGWRYRGWRGDFYPKGLVQRDELAYAARRLGSIEINGSFYSLQRPSSYASWARETPGDFEFAVKGGRFITHMKKLNGVESALANFFASGLLALGPKLGPVLWQLPATAVFDADRLAAFFAHLPRTTVAAAELATLHDEKVASDRALTEASVDLPVWHALEGRHPSFGTDEALSLLRTHDIACVSSDAGDKWPRFDEVTSDFAYVRLHGAEELYVSGYTEQSLDSWTERITAWSAGGADVYVYFDNDAKVHAPYDAMRLMERLGLSKAG